MEIFVGNDIKAACPGFKGMAIMASVENSPYCAELWDEIHRFSAQYCAQYTVDSVKEMSSIQATRAAYKKCGKDPSRYRPSGEALCRRILRGLELYQIDSLVDLINLASIASGYSIGGFDADKISGSSLTLGIGAAGEPYEGIGRGPLNIEGMPVYRDAIGGIGTPTSDHERTKLSLGTKRVLIIVNGYDGNAASVAATIGHLRSLLAAHCSATDFQIISFE